MTIKHWDDRELAKVSADLDAELEQLFDEMENVLTSSDEVEEPRLEFLPDDEPEPARSRSFPPAAAPLRPSEPQEDDFERKLAAIAPADDRQETTAAARPGRERKPEREAPRSRADSPEDEEQDSPAETAGRYGTPVAALSPEEFSRLMERAVARGVLAALKKWQRTDKN